MQDPIKNESFNKHEESSEDPIDPPRIKHEELPIQRHLARDDSEIPSRTESLLNQINTSSLARRQKRELSGEITKVYKEHIDGIHKRVQITENAKSDLLRQQVETALRLANSQLEKLALELQSGTRDEILDHYCSRVDKLKRAQEKEEMRLQTTKSETIIQGIEISLGFIQAEIETLLNDFKKYQTKSR